MLLALRRERASGFDKRNFRAIFAIPRNAVRGVLHTTVLPTNQFSNARTLLYIPWQYDCFCVAMIIRLFPTTGMSQAAGGRQPAAAKPHLYDKLYRV